MAGSFPPDLHNEVTLMTENISLAVLGIALIKGQLIGDYFMGLKAVSGFWRWVIFIWLFIPGGLITIAFMNPAT